MPRIPENQRTQRILPGQLSAAATPEQMGATAGRGMIQAGRGILSLAGAAEKLYVVDARLKDQKAREDEAVWLSKGASEYTKSMALWKTDPEQIGREDLPEAGDKFGTDFTNAYMKGAKTERAAKQFTAMMEMQRARDFASNAKTAEGNRISNMVSSFDQMTEDHIEAFRASGDLAAMDEGMVRTFATIDAAFPNSPQAAKAYKQVAASQNVFAILDSDPASAQVLLDTAVRNKAIGERERNSFQNRIDSGLQSVSVQRSSQIHADMMNDRAQWAEGQMVPDRPVDYWENMGMSPSAAANAKQGWDREKRIQEGNITIYNQNKGRSPEHIQSVIASVHKDIRKNPKTSGERAEIAGMLEQRLSEDLEMIRTDAATYVATKNPRMSVVTANATRSPEDFQVYVDSVYKFQGAAPEGEDLSMYLDLPSVQKRILTDNMVGQLEEKLSGNLTEQYEALQDVSSMYQGNAEQALVEAVRHGENIPTVLPFLYEHRNNPEIRNFMGVRATGKHLEALVQHPRSKYTQAFKDNGEYSTYVAAQTDENGQLLQFWGDTQNLLEEYAMYRTQQLKEAPQEAVKKTVKHMLDSIGHVTETGSGQPMILPVKTKNGRLRSGEEMDQISDVLEYLPYYIDYSSLKTTDSSGRTLFPIAGFDTLGKEERAKVLLDEISRNLVMEPGSDGQVLNLYYRPEGHPSAIELRNEANQALVLNLEQLPPNPKFMRLSDDPGVTGIDRDIPIKPGDIMQGASRVEIKYRTVGNALYRRYDLKTGPEYIRVTKKNTPKGGVDFPVYREVEPMDKYMWDDQYRTNIDFSIPIGTVQR